MRIETLEADLTAEGYRQLAGAWDTDSDAVAAIECPACGRYGREYRLYVKSDGRAGTTLCECGLAEVYLIQSVIEVTLK